MRGPRASSRKIAYDLRPSKQTERYILVELLHRLREAGIKTEDYRYIGFGAHYFYDFRLFHQLLGIRNLTSVEGSDSVDFQNRCRFNKPYRDLELYLGLSTDYLKTANTDQNHLIWLDYDFGYGRICYNDMMAVLPKFRSGTILIVTIDFERDENVKPSEFLAELAEEIPPDIMRNVTVRDMSAQNWRRTTITLIEKSIATGIYGRTDATFLRLLSFEYRDTQRMYTFGGMIVDAATRRKVLRVAKKWPFYCKDKLKNVKRIPHLIMTRKERSYLDEIAASAVAYNGEIGVSVEDFKVYKEYYRYLPVYSETV
jgi:hypothetical protein